ncbi:hypothetical protein [Burkholderia metallica]|uniref:hypothetical protein n=1 Tax=Burkholderia metallica TaxID=488729 RepID=UPI0015841DBF|nr:hypothetical protein [Burkholderia metallica]
MNAPLDRGSATRQHGRVRHGLRAVLEAMDRKRASRIGTRDANGPIEQAIIHVVACSTQDNTPNPTTMHAFRIDPGRGHRDARVCPACNARGGARSHLPDVDPRPRLPSANRPAHTKAGYTQSIRA